MTTKPETTRGEDGTTTPSHHASQVSTTLMSTKPGTTRGEETTIISYNPITEMEGATLSTHTIYRSDKSIRSTDEMKSASTLRTSKRSISDALSDIATGIKWINFIILTVSSLTLILLFLFNRKNFNVCKRNKNYNSKPKHIKQYQLEPIYKNKEFDDNEDETLFNV